MVEVNKQARSRLSAALPFVLALVMTACGLTPSGGTGNDKNSEDGDDSSSQNRPPQASGGEIVLASGEISKTIDLSTFVMDHDGDTLSVSALSVSNGQVVVDNGMEILYSTSTESRSGDEILYVVSDGVFEASGKLVIHIEQSVTNSPPVAVDDVATANSGMLSIFNVAGNDFDPDGDFISIQSVSSNNGVVQKVSDTEISFTAGAQFSGLATITYTIYDGENTSVGQLFVTVEASALDALISWSAPTLRVNGESLDPSFDISAYRVLYKESNWAEFQSVEVAGSVTEVLLEDIDSGTYLIKIATMDNTGLTSEYSEISVAIGLE